MKCVFESTTSIETFYLYRRVLAFGSRFIQVWSGVSVKNVHLVFPVSVDVDVKKIKYVITSIHKIVGEKVILLLVHIPSNECEEIPTNRL